MYSLCTRPHFDGRNSVRSVAAQPTPIKLRVQSVSSLTIWTQVIWSRAYQKLLKCASSPVIQAQFSFISLVVGWAGAERVLKTKPQSPGVSLKIIADFTPVPRDPEIQPHTTTQQYICNTLSNFTSVMRQLKILLFDLFLFSIETFSWQVSFSLYQNINRDYNNINRPLNVSCTKEQIIDLERHFE